MNTRPFCCLVTLLALAGGQQLRAQTAVWTEITHPTSPAFAHHDMTYDSLRHRLVLAGRTTPMPGGQFAAWAGAADGTWTQLPSPVPPPPGHDVEVAYDSYRDVVVLYTDATNKVWELSGTNWSALAAATTPIQCQDGALLQYDPLRHKTVLVGWQYPGNNAPSQTWLWDGANWALAAATNVSPPCATGGGLVFDSARGEMVLLTMHRMETWTFNGAAWTQRFPAHSPTTNLMLFHLAFDPVGKTAVFFGGEQTVSPYGHVRETWAWDGTDWRKLDTATVPPFNIDYAFAYCSHRGGLVMHGGWCEPDWNLRTNVWLLTFQPAAPQPAIRFTDLRPLAGQISLTSTGRLQTGVSQVLQATPNPALANTWASLQTNPAPTATNAWLVPRQTDRQFFRILERP